VGSKDKKAARVAPLLVGNDLEGMISRLMQFARDSEYQIPLKNVYRDGIMPSVLFNRFQIDVRSDSVKFEKTSPRYTRPFTVVLSFEKI
jgi:hypothetical protein